jgi:ADP-ribose pyrophosphatase
MTRTFRVTRADDKYKDAHNLYQALTVEYDGRTEIFPRLIRRPFVEIVPISEKGRTVIIKQFRFAVEREMWETVAGGIEIGEDPAVSAVRELVEESGIVVQNLIPLGKLDPVSSVVYHGADVYLAPVRDVDIDGLKAPAMEDQITDLKVLHLDEFDAMIESGEITCACTIATFYKARLYIKRHGLPPYE